MSIEALAMAGVDYTKCGIDFEEFHNKERNYTEEYLLISDDEVGEKKSREEIRKESMYDKNGDDQVKAQLLAWSRDVALLTAPNVFGQKASDFKVLGAKLLPRRLRLQGAKNVRVGR